MKSWKVAIVLAAFVFVWRVDAQSHDVLRDAQDSVNRSVDRSTFRENLASTSFETQLYSRPVHGKIYSSKKDEKPSPQKADPTLAGGGKPLKKPAMPSAVAVNGLGQPSSQSLMGSSAPLGFPIVTPTAYSSLPMLVTKDFTPTHSASSRPRASVIRQFGPASLRTQLAGEHRRTLAEPKQ